MGLFNKKKKETKVEKTEVKTEKKEPEVEAVQAKGQAKGSVIRQYIEGAGGTVVSRSILNGTSKLKWFFRQDGGQGNGWIAFGDKDTQEYVDNPDNMAIVDFNILAAVEPAVLDVFYMPYGADLEFCRDGSGAYFIDTRTGEEIRERVLSPMQEAFERNLKFLNKESYPEEFFKSLFQAGGMQEVLVAGDADFPTGEVVLSDPIAYLGSKYMVTLEKKIPAGSYPVELSICHSEKVGLRIAAARLVINGKEPVRHEIAMPKGSAAEDMGKPGVWAFFGVDGGLACFSDTEVAENYRSFIDGWKEENPGKNEYLDYFAPLFQESSQAAPGAQRPGGDFLCWEMPGTGHRLVMFNSGMGDGIYSSYWGIDEEGEAAELVIPFLNPEYI